MAVLKTLTGVHKWFLAGVEGVDGHAEAVGDHLHARRGPDRGRDDPVVMEIEDGRKVDLGTADVELGYVRCPFGVRRLCRELAVQHVLGCLTDLSSEGVVPFATTHQALQSEGAHQCEHGFLRHPPSLSSQDSEDTSVPVGALRIFEGLTNGFFELSMPVRVTESIPMVVERRSGEVRDRQQECQRKLCLEIIDSPNFRPSFLRPQGP